MGTIGAIAVGTHDDTEEVLQQVELMGSEVVEITTAGNLGTQTPRQVFLCLIVGGSRRYRKSHLHIGKIADGSAVDEFLHFQEIRKIAPIVSHEARYTRLLANAIDTCTILVGGCQRFLHIDGLAGTHRHDGKRGMRAGRRCHIDGVHLRIVDEFLGIGIPFLDAVTLCVGASALFRTAHHRFHMRPLDIVEGRPRFHLGHLATTYKSPTDEFHIC